MFFHYIYRHSAINRMHSPDLTDMRRAILEEDDDGPDGGFAVAHSADQGAPELRPEHPPRPV